MKVLHAILISSFLFLYLPCISQSLDQYNFKTITVNDNLSHSDINAIVQDLDGYLWIATNNGLNRYDGYEIKTFKSSVDDSTSIPGNRIRHMVVDDEGFMWVYIENLGVYSFDPRKMIFNKIQNEILDNLALSEVVFSSFCSQGSSLIIYANRGIIKLKTSRGKLIPEEWKIQIDKTKGNRFISFTETNRGVLCLFSNGGIFEINEGIQPTYNLNHDSERFGNIQRLDYKDGEVYAISNSHLLIYKFSGNNWTLKSKSLIKSNKNYVIRDFIVDINNEIWFSNRSKLHHLVKEYEDGEFTGNYRIDDLAIEHISRMFQDNYGVLWLATTAYGIYYTNLVRKPFQYLRHSTDPDRMISAIFRDQQEQIWLGAREGLTIFEKDVFPNQGKIKAEFLNGEYISFIDNDKNGRIWLGSKASGVYIVSEKDGRFKFTNIIEIFDGDLSALDNVMRITSDNNDRIWISTFNNGVFVFDLETKTFENLSHEPNNSNSLSSNNLTDVYYDKIDDCIWVGTRDAGLNKVSSLDKKAYSFKNYSFDRSNSGSLSSNHTWQVLRSRDSVLWVATLGGGLNKLVESDRTRTDSFVRYTTMNGLVDNDVEGLLEDHDGDLWLSGRGLSKFNVKEESFEHFDFEDGLQSNSFKVGAAFKDENNLLYFGGIKGINYFDPSLIELDSIVPNVIISQVKINDGKDFEILNPTNELEELSLRAGENNLSFSFVGLQFNVPLENKYQYRLLGHGDEWIDEKYPNLTANYLNVPPGEYIFQVRASNNDGIWSEEIAEVQLRIAKPWYASFLAYLSYFLLALGALYIFRKVTESQIQLENNLLLAEKEHEMDRSKLAFFTKISHELRTPLTLIKGPLEEMLLLPKLNQVAKNKLDLIQKNTNRLLNLTNKLLDFRKMETGNMALDASCRNITKFSNEILLLFAQSASSKEIEYEFKPGLKEIKVCFDAEKLEIILMNLLMNAYKYTEIGGKIKVELSIVGDVNLDAVWKDNILNENFVRIEIKDSGKGMSQDEIKKVFNPYYQVENVSANQPIGTGLGLSLVKGMVNLHKGDIIIHSEEGKGTRCLVHLPFGEKHFEAGELKESSGRKNSIEKYADLESKIISIKEKDAYLSNLYLLDKKYKILVVEDNQEINTYIKEVLEHDFVVEVAYNGMEGFEMALEFEPDLILSDVMMPVLDGIALCEKVKEHDKTAHIPIILLTARTSSVYQIAGLNKGAEDYISKPFSSSILKVKIHTIIRNRELQREFYRRQMYLLPVKETNLNNDEQLVHDAIRYVESNIDNIELGVVHLSEAMCQSRSNLYRKVKLVTGKSLVELIRDVKLKHAASLLKEQNFTVTEVAYKSGFSSIKYFRKCFKKQYAVNPSEFHSMDFEKSLEVSDEQVKYN